MTANDLLMQFQSDVLDVPVVRPAITETTWPGRCPRRGPRGGLLARPRDAARSNGARTPNGHRRWTPPTEIGSTASGRRRSSGRRTGSISPRSAARGSRAVHQAPTPDDNRRRRNLIGTASCRRRRGAMHENRLVGSSRCCSPWSRRSSVAGPGRSRPGGRDADRRPARRRGCPWRGSASSKSSTSRSPTFPAPASRACFRPGWFDQGAIKPDFTTADVRATQEFPLRDTAILMSPRT